MQAGPGACFAANEIDRPCTARHNQTQELAGVNALGLAQCCRTEAMWYCIHSWATASHDFSEGTHDKPTDCPLDCD
jgi:hypothetical protein